MGASSLEHLQLLLLLQGRGAWLLLLLVLQPGGIRVCQQVVLVRQDQGLGPHRPVVAAGAVVVVALLQPVWAVALHAVMPLLQRLLLLVVGGTTVAAQTRLAAAAVVALLLLPGARALWLSIPRRVHASIVLLGLQLRTLWSSTSGRVRHLSCRSASLLCWWCWRLLLLLVHHLVVVLLLLHG